MERPLFNSERQLSREYSVTLDKQKFIVLRNSYIAVTFKGLLMRLHKVNLSNINLEEGKCFILATAIESLFSYLQYILNCLKTKPSQIS